MKRDPLCPVNPVYATAPHLPCCVCAALAAARREGMERDEARAALERATDALRRAAMFIPEGVVFTTAVGEVVDADQLLSQIAALRGGEVKP